MVLISKEVMVDHRWPPHLTTVSGEVQAALTSLWWLTRPWRGDCVLRKLDGDDFTTIIQLVSDGRFAQQLIIGWWCLWVAGGIACRYPWDQALVNHRSPSTGPRVTLSSTASVGPTLNCSSLVIPWWSHDGGVSLLARGGDWDSDDCSAMVTMIVI